MKELEREFQKWVVDTATAYGWRVWHTPTPMRPIGGKKFVPDPRGRGLPDLFLIHTDPPRIVFAELKAADGVVSDDQREFLRLANGVAGAVRSRIAANDDAFSPDEPSPVAAYVWRPEHRSLIEDILRGGDL